MIVANQLKKLFEGLTLTYNEYKDEVTKGNEVTKDVLFSWGDQKELNKWVAGRSNSNKYPLIWYVMTPYTRGLFEKSVEVNAKIILFTSTQEKFYNETRGLINYNEILNPLFLKIEGLLLENPNSFEFSSKDIVITDFPKYGVGDDDFTNIGQKGTKSITKDFLDAKVIDLRIRVKENNC